MSSDETLGSGLACRSTATPRPLEATAELRAMCVLVRTTARSTRVVGAMRSLRYASATNARAGRRTDRASRGEMLEDLDALPDGVIVATTDGIVRGANRFAREAFGAMLGTALRDAIDEHDRARFDAWWSAIDTAAHEVRVGPSWFALRAARGSGDAIIVTVRPTSEPRAREDAAARESLRWKSAMLESLIAASPLGVYMVPARSDEIVWFNRRLCAIWQMEHLEAGMRDGTVKHSDVLAHCAKLIVGDALTPERCTALWREAKRGSAEIEVELHDGRFIRWLAAPVRDESGKMIGMLFLDEDITARKRAELERQQAETNYRELIDMRARLLQADRLATVGTLAAGVAHEVNNPLAYVLLNLGFIERTLNEDEPAPDPRRVEMMRLLRDTIEGVEHVRDIVRDLNTFSRPDDERRSFVDVRTVLDATLQMARHEIADRARVVREYEDVPSVNANESRLAQVFLNLVVNAAQAIHDPDPRVHEIRVSAKRHGKRRVVVEVQDTGVGIDPAHLGRIFDPFFTTKPVGIGTGLGLSICHGIVKSLGGDIDVASEPGRGTVVRVTLLAENEPSTDEHNATPGNPPR